LLILSTPLNYPNLFVLKPLARQLKETCPGRANKGLLARRLIEMWIIYRKPAREFLVGQFLSKMGLAWWLRKSLERGFNIDDLFEPGPEFKE
jgi:hypothetical protein